MKKFQQNKKRLIWFSVTVKKKLTDINFLFKKHKSVENPIQSRENLFRFLSNK